VLASLLVSTAGNATAQREEQSYRGSGNIRSATFLLLFFTSTFEALNFTERFF